MRATRNAKAKQDRAKKREQTVALDARMSTTRAFSVTEKSQRRYLDCYRKFELWLVDMTLKPTVAEDYDLALCRYLDHLFQEGENIASAMGVFAAVLFYHPMCGKASGATMHRCRQSMRGWKRLAPSRSRLPLPYEAVSAVANYLFQKNRFESAVALMVILEFYLRPQDLFRIRAADLVPPLAFRATGLWSMTLNPYEELTPSKTGEFDNSLMFDLPRLHLLGKVLDEMVARRLGKGWRRNEALHTALLFTVSHKELMADFKSGVQTLGLEILGPVHLYRLRHAAASYDFATASRSLEEIRLRGRWRSFTTVRRYEKGSRANQLLQKLTEALQRHVVACAASIHEVLARKRSCLGL